MPGVYPKIPKTALAFYAHPDDADVSCGATLALWSSKGAKVNLVICAKGEKGSRDGHLSPSDLEELRIAEVSAASEKIGISEIKWLSIPDGEIENSNSLREAIVGLVRKFRPDTVLCPDPTAVFFGSGYFNHRDHRELGWAVMDAVSPASALPHYYKSQGKPHQVSTVLLSGTLEPDVVIDVTDTIEAKLEAVLCHTSQIEDRGEWMREVISTRAQETGRKFGVAYAESFRLLELGS